MEKSKIVTRIEKMKTSFSLKDYFKTPFSIFVTFFYCAFSIYFIFQIPTKDLFVYVVRNPLNIFWYLSFLFLCWFNAYFHLKNLKLVSNNFVFYLILNGLFFGCQFLLTLVFFPYVPNDISDFLILLWFIFGTLSINLIWKVSFVLMEFRRQPLISKRNIFIAINQFIFLTYLLILISFLNLFLIQSNRFSIQDTTNIVAFMYVLTSSVILFYCYYKIYYLSERNFFKNWNNLLNFQSLFNLSFIRILPITIWFLSMENILGDFKSIYDFLYIGFSFFVVCCTFLLGSYFYATKKAEGVFILFLTTCIFLSSLTLFLLNYFVLVGNYSSMLIFLVSINFFILSKIIFKPKVNLIYHFFFNSFISSTIFYLFFSLVLKQAISVEFSVLPFNLSSIIDITWLLTGILLFLITIISNILDFGKISINISRLYKIEKKKKWNEKRK